MRWAGIRSPDWPRPKFREICFEIWVGPAFARLFSRFGRSGAQERKRPTFEKLARFVSRAGSMDPDAVPPDVASFSAGMTLTIGCKECPGAWTPDRARHRDSAPAAVYEVFGPALKKLWKQKFKLVMALPTSRHGSKVSRNLGGFFRNNTTKFCYTRPHEVPDCPKASRLSTFCYYKLLFDTTKYFLQVRGGARAKPADFSANYQRDHEQLNSRPQSRS